MVVVFVRHGERRRGETDPELTSAGRRMASETGRWLAARGFAPGLIVHTPTQRTRQTAEELASVLAPSPMLVAAGMPESGAAWEALVAPLAQRLGEDARLLLVGHHPTLHFLADTFGPLPTPVPRHHFAAALVLEPAYPVGEGARWRCTAAWPGRAA